MGGPSRQWPQMSAPDKSRVGLVGEDLSLALLESEICKLHTRVSARFQAPLLAVKTETTWRWCYGTAICATNVPLLRGFRNSFHLSLLDNQDSGSVVGCMIFLFTLVAALCFWQNAIMTPSISQWLSLVYLSLRYSCTGNLHLRTLSWSKFCFFRL